MPGVMPSTDATPSDVPCWTNGYHVRFDPTTGRLRKMDGWVCANCDSTINGVSRTLYSAQINGKIYSVIGTNSYLYSLIGGTLTNITPLQTSSTAAAASLSTHYGTLASNPITTVNGDTLVVVADTSASRYRVSDNYTLSGSSAVNGVPSGDLNKTHVIRAIGTNTVTIRVATAATSSGSGGGASVVRSDGLIRMNVASHGFIESDRIKISGAANTGGILAASINKEFNIRYIDANNFDFMTAGTATSSVTGGGGAGVVYYSQIAAGKIDVSSSSGYGAGRFGVGKYGTNRASTSAITYPRIWFVDRFGDNIISTAGNGTGLYTWNGDITVAPTLVSGAPTSINYAFVSNSIVVTLGASGVENRIFACDQANITQWTASSSNQVFDFTIYGAGRLISHVPVDDANIIFSRTRCYLFKYVGPPGVWSVRELDSSAGIIGPMARVSVNGVAYWMGTNGNFYRFRGGKPEILGSNVGPQSSILRYVFDNINISQAYKSFAFYNKFWNEIEFYYPSTTSNECDSVARYSLGLNCWVPDRISRTAAEYPVTSLTNPRLMATNQVFVHNTGTDDNGAPMQWSATTKLYAQGTNTAQIVAVIPDNTATGNYSLTIRSTNYPGSNAYVYNTTYTLSGTTERLPVTILGRYFDYTISGDVIGQSFLMGQWLEDKQPSSRAP